MEGMHWLVGVIAAFGVALSLRGGFFRTPRSARAMAGGATVPEPVATTAANGTGLALSPAAAARSPEGILHQWEVRLYDYGRDVEARIDHRLAMLDVLIQEADQEIARLEALLAESRLGLDPHRTLTDTEIQRGLALAEAGFADAEIARCLQVTPDAVAGLLQQWDDPSRRAA